MPLREWFPVLGISSPWVNNVGVVLLELLWVKLVIEFVTRRYVRGRRNQPGGGSGAWSGGRPILQWVLTSTILFWPLFDTTAERYDNHDGKAYYSSTNWSWRLNAIVPAALMARFIYKGAIVKDLQDIEVQTLSQSPSDLLFGPLQLAAIMVWLGWTHFMTQEAVIIAAALASDGCLAPMVGALFGRHVYQLPLTGTTKTMEGSVVGIFLGTVSGCYMYFYMTGIPCLPLRMVLAYGAIAAVVEGTSIQGLDNLSIAMALHFSMPRVQALLLLLPASKVAVMTPLLSGTMVNESIVNMTTLK